MHTSFILRGGPGNEHDVSLISWKNLFNCATRSGYNAQLITISKTGEWIFEEASWNILRNEVEGLVFLKTSNALVFPIIHGNYGEDGQIQSKLEAYEIPFVGSNSLAMQLTIDKQKTGDFLSTRQIRTPQSFVIQNVHDLDRIHMAFPVIIKPRDEWSSVSLYKAENSSELQEIIKKELAIRSDILIQEFVSGREFTCGVIELSGKIIVLPPTEVILTKGDLFDYTAKYQSGGCIEVTPAEIPQELTEKIQQTALKVHNTCGCKDISRTDMIMRSSGELVVLEINTIPGMTNTSFIPAQLKSVGYSLEDFVKSMMEKYS